MSTEITTKKALEIIKEKSTKHRPGNGYGFSDTQTENNRATIAALTHSRCRDCSELTCLLDGNRVSLKCQKGNSPFNMWSHAIFLDSITPQEPNCEDFSAK